MKLPFSALMITIQIASVLSAVTPAECGDLGVMEVPEGVDPSTVRKCADHPLRRRPRPHDSSVPPDSINQVKAVLSAGDTDRCYHAAPFGCDRNYCWKNCGVEGDGKWCWLAHHGGSDTWVKCWSWYDCQPQMTLDAGCGKGCMVSNACGCGC